MWTATWSILLHLYHLPIILAEDTPYPDTCNYDYTGYMCGDSCTQQTILCSCGDTTLDYHSSQYCCTAPGDHCSKEDPSDYFSDTVCPTGRPVDKSSPCHGVCYNDYHRSESFGPDAHVWCGGENSCVRVLDMCRGLQCPEAAAECEDGKRLRCSQGHVYNDDDGGMVRNISISGGEYFYCDFNSSRNTLTFENLDRSDEGKIENIFMRTKAVRDFSLESCTTEGFENDTGLMCGEECKGIFAWCRGRDGDGFKTTCSNERDNVTSLVQTTDPRLCGDKLFWRGVDCTLRDHLGDIARYGRHCQGTSQQVIFNLSILFRFI